MKKQTFMAALTIVALILVASAVRFVNVSLPEVHLTHVPVYSWFPEQFATAV
jgi:hypothetical protein